MPPDYIELSDDDEPMPVVANKGKGRASAILVASSSIDLTLHDSPQVPSLPTFHLPKKAKPPTQSSQIEAFSSSPIKHRAAAVAAFPMDLNSDPPTPIRSHPRNAAPSEPALFDYGSPSSPEPYIPQAGPSRPAPPKVSKIPVKRKAKSQPTESLAFPSLSSDDDDDSPIIPESSRAAQLAAQRRRADRGSSSEGEFMPGVAAAGTEGTKGKKSKRARVDDGASVASGSTAAAPKAKKAKAAADGLTPAERKVLKEQEKKEKALQKAEEKKEKARLGEANKLKTKNDLISELKLFLSPHLFLPSSPLFSALSGIQERLSNNQSSMEALPPFPADEDHDPAIPNPEPGFIKFKRHIKAVFNETTRVWDPLGPGQEHWKDEGTMLLVTTAKDLASIIVSPVGGGAAGVGAWYRRWIRRAGGRAGATEMVMIISGMKAYLSKGKSVKTKKYREEVGGVMAGIQDAEAMLMDGDEEHEMWSGVGHTLGGPSVAAPPVQQTAGKVKGKGRKKDKQQENFLTTEEFDGVLTKLFVTERCFQVQVDTKGEMEEWIWNLSADLAFRPTKKIEQSHLPFHAGVTAKGKDPHHTFRLMLEKIPGITDSAADGIVRQHGSFAGLMKIWERMEREEEDTVRRGEALPSKKDRKENLLVGVQIRNTTSGAEMDRAIGNITSSKIFGVFRGRDPSALIRDGR